MNMLLGNSHFIRLKEICRKVVLNKKLNYKMVITYKELCKDENILRFVLRSVVNDIKINFKGY